MNAEQTKKIQAHLEKKFPKVNVFPNNEPIKNSIHCTDYDVDGTLVRGRWFSPWHKGNKQGLMFFVITDEQKAEMKAIEEKMAKKKTYKDIKV